MRKLRWALPFACLCMTSCVLTPGGGGSTQSVRDSVKDGEAIVIKLELTVWGSGGIKDRYKDVVASYRRVGETGYETVAAKLLSQSDKSEMYEFIIPAFPNGTGGEVEYFIEMKMDGQLNHIQGIKKVRIDHS